MTLSKEVRRFALEGFVPAGLTLSAWLWGLNPIEAAPGFVPVRPGLVLGARSGAGPHVRAGLRGDVDPRRARHEGGGLGGGVGIAVLPVVPPIDPGAASTPALQDQAPAGRLGERWAADEPPQRAACIRPLIIELRAPPPTMPRRTGPRVIYGAAPPVCPRG